MSTNCSTPNIINKNKCTSCQLFMSPILGFDLCMGISKSKALKKFDQSNIYYNETFSKIDELERYNVSKKITLPNGEKVLVKGTLGFKNNELYHFIIEISIGRDYKYFDTIRAILESKDKDRINHFIYEKGKYIMRNQEGNCKMKMDIARTDNDNRSFSIHINYFIID